MGFRGLESKVAVVTGGAAGVGAATVARLVDEGMKVVAVDRRIEELQKSLARYPADRVAAAAADIATEEGCASFAKVAVSRFGALNCLVNNAGILQTKPMPLAELPVADFDRVMTVNARGTFLAMAAGIRQMVKQGVGGSIVNISSSNVLRALPDRAAYNASKHAVIGLTNTAAIEYGPHRIRVNAIYPGPVNTSMSSTSDATRAAAGFRMDFTLRPIPRKAQPEEIAGFIAWLLSDEASFQTGGAYTIDGGATA
jgi:NAD(P)-dependent dehydrogenase (short-subunit alcohol dehydrogenase family)